jgi:3'-5' exoribonuclease
MEQTTLTPSRCFVRDLADGQEVNEVFLVRAHNRRQKRNGENFLKLQLGDTTGAVEAVIWDEVDALAPICPTG